MDTFHSVPLGSPDHHIRKTEIFPQTSEVSPIEIHNQVPTAPVLQLLNDRDHILQLESSPQTSEVLPIEVHNQVSAAKDRDHIRQIESFPQISEVPPIANHNQIPTAPVLQLLNDRDHIQQTESFPQTSEVLPIKNNHDQVSTAPVLQLLNDRDHIQQIESFPQTSEVLPIENNHNQVSTAPALQLLNNSDHVRQIESLPQTSEVLPIENHSQIPTVPALQLLNDRDHVLTDIQEEDVEISVKLIDKPNPPSSFPTLPEPMPLRKSTKPRDPSMNAVLLGAATPGAPVGGKRSSWLMKAREAKALDGLSKKSHPPGMGSDLGASSSLTIQGTKRKSDPFSLPQVGIRDDERPPKLAKTSEGETESQSQPPMIMDSAQEGVFDRLKKVVEDLGIRVGQTVGMSVGSDTATVLAEARAAAKAKVAERDRNLKEEELTMALPASETVEHKTIASQPHSESPPPQDEEVSKLLSSTNTKGKQPDVMKVLQMAAVAAKKVNHRWQVVVPKLIIRFFLV